jgi:hypothetical protein
VPRLQHTLAFESFGLAAEVTSDDRELFDRFRSVLPPGWCALNGTPPAVRFGLMRDGTITLDGTEVSRADGDLTRALAVLALTVRHHVAQHAPGYVFVHAGVVRVHGVGIVIPGSSFSGKTTLVAELVRVGATYYSDEYAVVDAEGMVHAYAKPLSIRSDTCSDRHDVPVPDAQIGAAPMQAGLVVVTDYEHGVSWRPVPLTPAQGALVLLEHTVAVRAKPGDALIAARLLAQNAVVIAGARGEASVAAAAILEACASIVSKPLDVVRCDGTCDEHSTRRTKRGPAD